MIILYYRERVMTENLGIAQDYLVKSPGSLRP